MTALSIIGGIAFVGFIVWNAYCWANDTDKDSEE